MIINPLTHRSETYTDFARTPEDFTQSNAKRFYLSTGKGGGGGGS